MFVTSDYRKVQRLLILFMSIKVITLCLHGKTQDTLGKPTPCNALLVHFTNCTYILYFFYMARTK